MTKRLAAVKATPTQFQPRPEWAYRDSKHNQAAYVRAVNWLRRGKKSLWLLDADAVPAKWRALPKEGVRA